MSLATSIKENLIKMIFASYDTSSKIKDEFYNLITDDDKFYGKNSNTHFTASALVINKTHDKLLLLNHKKYNQWLAFGGHWNDTSDIQETIYECTVREMMEEAYGNNIIPCVGLNNMNPISLDSHDAAGHLHYDLAFLIEVDESIPYVLCRESKEISWFDIDFIIKNENNLFNKRLVKMAQSSKEITTPYERKRKSDSKN